MIYPKSERKKNMSAIKTLDLSIKKSETGDAKIDKYYEIDGKQYDNYIDNDSWSHFVEEMRVHYPKAYDGYSKGSGDELGIKKVGKYPPKMASYGSSGRMIYLLSREIPNFCFEEKLPTSVGGTANMDGYVYSSNTHFYIEAKCREPYAYAKKTVDRAYENLYRYINESELSDFSCIIQPIDDKKMDVRFISKDIEIRRFDIKQMLCHLLGIATEKLTNSSNENTVFLYLLYNPNKIEIVAPRYKEQLLAIYKQELTECESIPFAELYRIILQYLNQTVEGFHKTESEIQKIASSFTFAHCDQDTYADYFN